MPTLIFVDHKGNAYDADAPVGSSVMEAAVNNGIDGILAECGGNCSCATCHVYVDPAWVDRLPPAAGNELGTLEAVNEPRATSRLSCQITVHASMEGATFHLPERQY